VYAIRSWLVERAPLRDSWKIVNCTPSGPDFGE
jgi:hypothetical protein